MKCPYCEAQELCSGDVDGMCSACRNKAAAHSQQPPIFVMNYGWVCPKCGYVYSPFTAECDRCNGANIISKLGLNGGTISHIRNDNVT